MTMSTGTSDNYNCNSNCNSATTTMNSSTELCCSMSGDTTTSSNDDSRLSKQHSNSNNKRQLPGRQQQKHSLLYPNTTKNKVHLSLRSLTILCVEFGCVYMYFLFLCNTTDFGQQQPPQHPQQQQETNRAARPVQRQQQGQRQSIYNHQDEEHPHHRRPMPVIDNCTAIYPTASEIIEWKNQRRRGPKDEEGHQQQEEEEEEDERCALLFFGLAKAFRKLVLPSIQEHILDQNPTCDIFVHTYDVRQLSNIRNGEVGQKIDPTQVYDMTSNVLIESLDEYEQQHNLTYLLQPKFRVHSKHGWAPISYPNMLKQWHSISKVWKLMEQYESTHDIDYDRVGLFRSDVYYVTDISIKRGSSPSSSRTEADTNNAVVPAFGKMGNDRMFYGTYDNAFVWANIRYPSVDCYKPEIPTQGLHSEHFMERLILPNIPNWTERRDICFLRVRGEGEIQEGDCMINYDGPTDWKQTVKRINHRMTMASTVNKNLKKIVQ